MHAMDASGLLDVWECGYAQAPPRRTLALLAYAHADLSRTELGALSLGRRDALLLRLRLRLFGSELAFVSTCPACASVVESSLDLAQMPLDVSSPLPQTLRWDKRSIAFRVPTVADLIDLPDDPETARRALAARCISGASVEDAQAVAEALPEPALAALGAAMSTADPTAAARFELECPDCRQRWQSGFDIANFLWREVDAWARRTVRDVHTLARAYAWSEREVLALSPTRRQMYLELCRA